MAINLDHKDCKAWKNHIVRAGEYFECPEDIPDPEKHREQIEPWLAALLQAEHLNLLVGSGFTTAIAKKAAVEAVDMARVELKCEYAKAVNEAAKNAAKRLRRDTPNLENQIQSIGELIGGLKVFASGASSDNVDDQPLAKAKRLLSEWESELDRILHDLLNEILTMEHGVAKHLEGGTDENKAHTTHGLLSGFLLPFASRTVSRDRLHIFTTNYDRLLEYGCDLTGLRVLDRFVGNLMPVFRASRLGIDLHYNPPGLQGEPYYLEGVVRLTKLHGSLDWRTKPSLSGRPDVIRCALPFGAPNNHPEIPKSARERLLIYPNAAKDVETLEYPYAELFRDFAAAVCRPNAVLVTYGYGFGDDHINRVLRDMLSLPSTHLIIISYDQAGGRLPRFYSSIAGKSQITLLVGSHFGDLKTLVTEYLPRAATERTVRRMAEILRKRQRPSGDNGNGDSKTESPRNSNSE